MYSFFCFVGVAVATLYFALAYESTTMLLLFYMETVFFVFSFGWLLFRKFTVKGYLEVPVGVSEPGKENFVRLAVLNKGRVPIQRMKALVVVKNGLLKKRKRDWITVAAVTESKAVFTHSVFFSCAGNYVLTLRKLRIYDGTGLLYSTISVKRSTGVQVIPKLHDVPVRLTEATKNFYGESQVYDEHASGHDNSEIFQIREYQKGDRLQHVHWKLTAKQEELMVKEYSLPKTCPVVLFLSFYQKKRGKWQRRLLAYLEIAVSLSYSMMEAGCPHYIVWFDGEEQDIKRVRVDDEESLFYFMGNLMQLTWERAKENIVCRYREKFRQEPYAYGLSLDEDLTLRQGDEVIVRFPETNPEEALEKTELLL